MHDCVRVCRCVLCAGVYCVLVCIVCWCVQSIEDMISGLSFLRGSYTGKPIIQDLVFSPYTSEGPHGGYVEYIILHVYIYLYT